MVKKRIPKKIKDDSWNKYIGREKGIYNCLCCYRTEIDSKNFIAGHIVSEKNGGLINLNNIIPICVGCNGSMGSTNMLEYIRLYENDRYEWFKNNIVNKNNSNLNKIINKNPKKKKNKLDSNNPQISSKKEYQAEDKIQSNYGFIRTKIENKFYYVSNDKFKYIFKEDRRWKDKYDKIGEEIGKYKNNHPIFYHKIDKVGYANKYISLYLEKFNVDQLRQIVLLGGNSPKNKFAFYDNINDLKKKNKNWMINKMKKTLPKYMVSIWALCELPNSQVRDLDKMYNNADEPVTLDTSYLWIFFIKKLIFFLANDIGVGGGVYRIIKECKCQFFFIQKKTAIHKKYIKCNKCNMKYKYNDLSNLQSYFRKESDDPISLFRF